MEASDGNEGIMSKSPQNFSQDPHKVMAGALASSTVQNFNLRYLWGTPRGNCKDH
jgi:hypothetical protein